MSDVDISCVAIKIEPTFIYIFVTDTFKQVAKTVMDVNLSDNVVDVVYKMFDENGNKFFINNMTIASVMFYLCVVPAFRL